MTIPKTYLVAALLLLAAAAAAQKPHNYTIYNYTAHIVDSYDHSEVIPLQSVGPYDYDPQSTVRRYLSWFPPHAVPMNLRFLNVTWWKPETIWLVGTYYVRISGVAVPATIYVVQDGVRMNLQRARPANVFAALVEWHVRHICALGVAMVVPNKIIVLDYTTQVWISDVYCLYGNQWYWLRLLPYALKNYLIVEGIELVNARIEVEIPSPYPWPLIPAGWYLDPATMRVFRVPNDTAVMTELQRARMRISELETELADRAAQLTRLNATAARLNASLAETREEAARLSAENLRLRAQLEALNYTRAQLEVACRSQLEVLRSANDATAAQLARLTAENQALKAQIASMNETLAKLNEEYASQTAQLQTQLETWTRAAWIGAALGAAAGAAAAALALRRRK